MSIYTLAIALSLTLACVAVARAQPLKLKQFDSWSVYSYKSDGKTACYALAGPTDKKPATVDHGDNFFIVAPGGTKPSSWAPQAVMGYDLKPDAGIRISIGDQNFSMFSKGNNGWMEREERGPDIVRAMKSGRDMVLHATSRRGTATTYTYSLQGITAALQSVQNCK